MGRSEEEFLSSTLGKVVWAINKHRSSDIGEKNILVDLFRSIGSKYPYFKDTIQNQKKEKDVYVDSFNDML